MPKSESASTHHPSTRYRVGFRQLIRPAIDVRKRGAYGTTVTETGGGVDRTGGGQLRDGPAVPPLPVPSFQGGMPGDWCAAEASLLREMYRELGRMMADLTAQGPGPDMAAYEAQRARLQAAYDLIQA